jgi:5-methylcytosine-specific restriction endonuclease McrA
MRQYKVKACLKCGKEYQPMSSRQKYCVDCGNISERELNRLSVARYRKANRKKAGEAVGKWAKANPEKVREKDANYRKANPEKGVFSHAKRRALKYANTPVDELLTLAQWRDVLAQYNGHCAYCSKKAKLTLDHVIPLSKGGKHSKDNVVPACGRCNSSKGARTSEERFGLAVAK